MPDIGISGGAALEAKLRELSAKVTVAAELRVGFLEKATPYQDGTPTPLVAAVQEFGAPAKGIPPRPFFRNMVAAKSPEWGAELGRRLTRSDYDSRQALGGMGQRISGQLRQSIYDTNSPPLAPATIAAKESTKPLVDTGHMLASVDFEVDETP